MQHDERGLDALGEIERLERVFDGQFALARPFVGKFVEVRRGMIHPHGQRTKIVEAGNFDFTRVHGFQNAGQEAEPDAVAEFGPGKAEVADFAQHCAPVRVAFGIPAGGKRVHVRRLK